MLDAQHVGPAKVRPAQHVGPACSQHGSRTRLQFKLRVEMLMLEIKDRNHNLTQFTYSADDAARVSFLKRTALPGLRWGKLPADQ